MHQVRLLALLTLSFVALPARALVTDRFGHTATLLPDGRVFIAGGTNGAGATLTSTEYMNEQDGTESAGVAITARSSHTATLLPNGTVVLAGGVDAAGTGVEASIQIVNPITNTVVFTGALTTARHSHTATLLPDGNVLICGGQTNVSGATTYAGSCQVVFNDATVTAEISMLTGGAGRRGHHTATLLRDGRVFLAGGMGDGNTPLSTTLIYTCAAPGSCGVGSTISPAKSLLLARAYHQATMMADGRILITGGFNGDDRFVTGHKVGYINTVEIYDPVSDSVQTAQPMQERKAQHTATLQPDGSVLVFGGIGNITTTYIQTANFNGRFSAGTLNGCFSGACGAYTVPAPPPNVPFSTMTINNTTSNASATFTFPLSIEATGVINDGEILMSSPIARIPGGKAEFVYGASEGATATPGLKVSLNGLKVQCINGVCGQVQPINTTTRLAIPLAFTNVRGTYQFDPIDVAPDATSSSNSCIKWGGAAITNTSGQVPITDAGGACTTNEFAGDTVSYACGNFNFEFDEAYTGASLSSASMVLLGGTWAFDEAQTINYTATFEPPTGLVSAGNGVVRTALPAALTGSAVTLRTCFRDLEGRISVSTDTPQASPADDAAGTGDLAVSVRLNYALTRVNLEDVEFEVDVATVIIRRMVFQDFECYKPKNNAWDFNCVTRGDFESLERFGHTATLLPSGDVHYIGGRGCNTYNAQGACSSFVPSGQNTTSNASVYPPQDDLTVVQRLTGAWGATPSMSVRRGNFTMTTLPSGKILIAGGTNGQNVLPYADLYDPVDDSLVPTARLTTARDLHTATLLINGRVLVAGGFATSPTTGTTATTELYFPETGVWLPAAPLTQARDNHTATVMPDGQVIVVGGYRNGEYLGTVERYNQLTNAWTTIGGGLNTPRALHTATLLRDGRLLVTGGVNEGGVLTSAEVMDPVTGNWTAVTPMPEALHSHGAAQLADGDVLVAGGNNGLGEVTSTYRYRPAPAPGTWTPVTGMNNARMNHTLTLVPNGHVLAAGGAQINGNTTNGVEMFHANGNYWSFVSSMTANRAYHSTILTVNNFFAAFGGYDGTQFLATGETFGFMPTIDGETLISPSVRQSSITSLSAVTIARGAPISVYGSHFKGETEGAGGGGASGNSEHSHPRLLIQAVDHSGGTSTQGNGGFLLNLSTYVFQGTPNWFASSATLTTANMPPLANEAALPYGWYQMRVVNNAVYSGGRMIQAAPARPTGALGAVTGVAVSSTIMNWSWGLGSVAGQAGFNVYSATTGILIAQLTNAAAVSYTQSRLQPGVTAQIMVAPYSVSGDGSLAYSGTYYTFASSPTAVSVASVSVTSLHLRWDTNNNAPGTVYEVSMSTDVAPFTLTYSTPIPTSVVTTTDNVLIQGLAPNRSYSFRVQAYNIQGIASSQSSPPTVSGFSNVVTTTTRQTVSGLAGSPTATTSISWAWTDMAINGGAGDRYRVYNATSGALVASVQTPLFIDVGLGTNTPRVIAVSVFINGVGEGPLTDGVTVHTLAAIPLPASPAIFSLSTGGFVAAWTANGNPPYTQYESVITAQGPIDGGGSPNTSTTTTTGFFGAISGATPPASVFDVRVRAVNQDGVATDDVDPLGLLVIGTTSTFANPPTSLSLVNTSPSAIAVSWNENNNSSSATYEVTYTTDSFVADVRYALTFGQGFAGDSAVISGLLTSTTYSIRVRARNLDGVITPYSNVLTTSTFNGGAPPGAVGAFLTANQQATIEGSLGNGRTIRMFVPAGTFPVPVFIAISSHNTTQVPVNPCGNINVGIHITMTPKVQPEKPVLLTLGYLPAELGAVPTSQAALMRYDPAAARCVPLETTFGANTFTAKLNHFSMFQLAQVVPQANPDFALIFPNPFYPTKGHGYVTFSQLPRDTRVEIFTLRGESVWEGRTNGSGLLTWNGVNRFGRPTASGVYLAVAEHDGRKHVYKVAVVR